MNLITPKQAAETLRVNVDTLRRWLRTGKIPAAKTQAGWQITDHDLEMFLAARQHRPPEPEDDDADLVAEAEAVLDRIARGEEWVWTFDEWIKHCDALDG